MLANTAVEIIHPIPHLDFTCHNATLYWLYQETFNKPPTIDQYTAPNGVFYPITPKMSSLLLLGTPLTKPYFLKLSLKPGSIIIFAKNNDAGHSCVAKSESKIVGYNQLSWFKENGKTNSFTTHDVEEIRWNTGKGDRNNVMVGEHYPQPYKLVTIKESTAKEWLTKLAKK